ncbi:cytochrome c [Suttonella sp. R2A3]|uniref:c-type cytochrome n=1 Tax=Suttonella sp. R2A3 TaxID=2908648 RepID=UPI001F23A1D3|nr:cytochrome c [Suttonella sp. R2A3]UJF24223.1 cytochrome c [Suttonella sp. R2A3]
MIRKTLMTTTVTAIAITAVFATTGTMPGVSDPARMESLYQLHCQGCHLPGGEGFPEHDVPRMTDTLGHFARLEEGRRYLIQVPGSFGAPIDNQDLAEITNWMIYTFSPNTVDETFKPFTAEEVSRLRKAYDGDILAKREELVDALKAAGNYPDSTQ